MNPITFDYKGARYELEFTRKTAKSLMGNGLTMQYLQDNPLDAIPRLFYGAFNANHARTTMNMREEIFNNIGDKESLLEALYELYLAPFDEVMAEPEDDSAKITWGRE